MDIKRWAGTKIGMGGAPPGAAPAMPVPGAPPAMPGASPGGFPKAMGAGMYGPPSPPLFNPEITSAVLPPTMAAWAQAGGTAPEHPMGPPPWADDAAAFAHAQALVKKSWEAYKEPWSVVAMVYDAMKGAGGSAPPGAAPGGPPPGGAPPGGPPKPGFPGAKPGLPGAKPGFPGAKPPGAILMNFRLVNTLMGVNMAIFFAYSTTGCPAPAPQHPVVDVSDASVDPDDDVDGAVRFPACQAACARLRSLGCPEASTPDGGRSCYRLCADAEESQKFDLKPACVAGAVDVAAVRSCGSVRCQK